MRKSTIYLFILGVAVVVMAAIASTGVAVSAQNSNSSTTNMNMAKPKPKPRRHKRTAKPATTGDAISKRLHQRSKVVIEDGGKVCVAIGRQTRGEFGGTQ